MRSLQVLGSTTACVYKVAESLLRLQNELHKINKLPQVMFLESVSAGAEDFKFQTVQS